MFRGQFNHTVDAKGRVALPSRFRDECSPGLIVTPALFDPCLHVFPLAAWEALEEKVAALPSLDPHVVRFRRLYISAACECEVDKAGRVLVPGHLRQHGRLERDVLCAGMGRHFELWSREEWDKALVLDPAEQASFQRAVLEQIKI
ncbi:MAG TPA: division/cell wall cluster transcriptional repressor MraZ [Polyangiaceae bacterium]|nr:division/cell wall cluster transcriptional repressor MraZ [Polyangiaceae bacterium]